MSDDTLLWQPSPATVEHAAITRFGRFVGERTGRTFSDYFDLHRWSVDDPGAFWDALWDFVGVKGEKGGRALADGDLMPGARFFPDGALNFAENLLSGDGDSDAIVFRGEDKVARRTSWSELRALVSRLQKLLADAGVGKGDRVAAMMPNMPETIAVMLATSALGATFSSCSPDFGERGVLDRFGQIEPKVFVAPDGYWYNGKRIEIRDKLAAILGQLPTVRRTVIVPYLGEADDVAAALPGASSLEAAIAPYAAGDITFTRVPFDQPLYILFSSGTTGVPKCIVHSAGGTLLQHFKEQMLHSDIRAGDRIFYFTTCGWMMWNWLASGLAVGATLLLYDGSPFHPDGNTLFGYAADERARFFGTSAKFIDSVKKAGLTPGKTFDLSAIETIASTGSPLAPESFDFVYSEIKADVHLASISGGTDICGCFVLGVPTLPVHRGELQAPGLGMAVDIYDEDGKPIRQEKGELVCTKPFASMPVMFWNDPEGAKYRAAYFERFPGIWCHGDFAEITAHGGYVIYGRSDATLNPGGVRIGTAEIYSQVEQIPEVIEALAIGQEWDDDVRVVLFVVLQAGAELDEALTKRIREKIKTGASPRHVPARVVAVDDIPRTKSGKITELAVRDVVHGRDVKNKEALANPEALDLYADLPELRA